MLDRVMSGPRQAAPPEQAIPKAVGSAVKIRSVERSFGRFKAIDQVTLDVAPGEFVTLLGPSGSGKSTLLNMVAGFQGVDQGEILVDGRPIQHVPTHKRGFGMAFQSYALFPNMTVSENVAFPLRMAGIARAESEDRVRKTLEVMHLTDHIDKMPNQMSGGQQQRVAIARAIVKRPHVVLMDEPLSALDRRLREAIQLEIRDLHKRIGSTILFVTHDQGEALTLSDRIAVLNEGRIVQVGTPFEIYRHPVDRFVASFIGESNLIRGQVETQSGQHITVVAADGLRFQAPAPKTAPTGDVTVLVRPERLTFTDAGDPSALEVEVTSAVFLGEILRIKARTTSGESILIRNLDSRHRGLPSLGERLHVRWSVDDCWVLS